MNEILRLKITPDSYIYFHTEDELNTLFQFTEIKIGLHNEGKEDIILYHSDNLGEALRGFYNISKRVLSGEDIIANEFENNSIGFWWNEYLNESLAEELGDKMISPLLEAVRNREKAITDNATFIYCLRNKIILEIGEVYSWHFLDPEPEDDFKSYEAYIENYTSKILFELDENTIKQWYTQVCDLIQQIDLCVD